MTTIIEVIKFFIGGETEQEHKITAEELRQQDMYYYA